MTVTSEALASETRANIAGNLRLLRRVTGAKAQEVADAIGISRQAFQNRMAHDDPTPCSAEDLALLALYFGVPVDVFYGLPQETLRRLPDLGVAVFTCNAQTAA